MAVIDPALALRLLYEEIQHLSAQRPACLRPLVESPAYQTARHALTTPTAEAQNP